jgi:hypothetical protein
MWGRKMKHIKGNFKYALIAIKNFTNLLLSTWVLKYIESTLFGKSEARYASTNVEIPPLTCGAGPVINIFIFDTCVISPYEKK